MKKISGKLEEYQLQHGDACCIMKVRSLIFRSL